MQMQNLSIIHSYTQIGIAAIAVDVEVHLANGLPAFNVVGMPETVVKESKDRVRSAIISSGFEFPARRITVNLAPADVPKVGGRFDLPIALGILIASGQFSSIELNDYAVIGELALTGEVKAVSGCLPTAVACQSHGQDLLLPFSSASEASLVENLSVIPLHSLTGAVNVLLGQEQLLKVPIISPKTDSDEQVCFSDICGQIQAKRVLEVAACGGHHLLMSGPPGCGKTMLASRFSSILPELSIDHALETASIYSVSNLGFDINQWRQRPYRAPHHSASAVALIGGGSRPLPGEISLAHNGVLFLDELPEFSSFVLDQLREPIESGYINIVRAGARVKYLSRFQLIAAMNPCKCGYYGDQMQPDKCRCSIASIERYQSKVSGPLLDRIDLHLHLSRVPIVEMQTLPKGENSRVIAERVKKTQHYQFQRQGCLNAELSGKSMEKNCAIDNQTQQLLMQVETKFNLTARGYVRVLKVARTIADLNKQTNIKKEHIMEALNYRLVS